MKIGYACKLIGVDKTQISGCRLKNISKEKLWTIIHENLNALDKIVDYNINQSIFLFRISSDIIPFGSHPEFDFDWQTLFAQNLIKIGEKIKSSRMRVSMHPGQYTVLNSNNEGVVERAVLDLEYHCNFLDALGVGSDCKIVIHIGGIYGQKVIAMGRFIGEYNKLDQNIRRRLVIENDQKCYTVQDAISIYEVTNVPVIFDNLHHDINKAFEDKNQFEIINLCSKTWGIEDGPQKIHYSQQRKGGRQGHHSSTIDSREFVDFVGRLVSKDIDIMLEVKDKNLSAVKCINITNENIKTNELDIEWARYKYLVLSKSQKSYNSIRMLLKDKTGGVEIAREFYRLVEYSINKPSEIGQEINAASHIWGYFKNNATSAEKEKYEKNIKDIRSIKRILKSLSIKYDQEYLLKSYYFEAIFDN